MSYRSAEIAKLEKSTHAWRRDEFGEIDWFAVDADPHNGPECERCDYSFCWNCATEDPAPCRGEMPLSDPSDLQHLGNLETQ